MVGEDIGLPGGGIDVGVDFGGEDGFVTEHFLDDAKVGAVLDEMGRERVPEGVRGNLLVDAGNLRLILYHIKYRYPTEGRTRLI